MLQKKSGAEAVSVARRLVPMPVRTTTSEGQNPESENLANEYLRLLIRHRRSIALFGVVGLVIALLITVPMTPVYRTRTSLEIQALNRDFLNLHDVTQTGTGSGTEEDVALQTQIKLLQADTLIAQTQDRLLSVSHPESVEQGDLLTRLLVLLHLPHARDIPYESLLADTANRTKVKPLGMTRLVEVTCESWDRETSAKFCNALIAEFQTEDMKTRSAEARKTSEFLTQQLADVRVKAEEAQRRLQAAVGNDGLMLSSQASTVGEERLRGLEEELVKAESERMQKESALSASHTASIDSSPAVMDNPAYRQYQEQLAQLRSQLAQLVPPLTEQNPKVIHVRAQIRAAEAGMAAARDSVSGRASVELTAARHREDMLRATYQTQEGLVSTGLQKASQVSLLRREMESGQQLYQTLLQRAREAGFVSAMQTSTIRVVDTARTPVLAATPYRVASAAGGLTVGCIAGMLLFLYRERTRRPVRLPGQAEQYLHLDELGIIPHSSIRVGMARPQSMLSLSAGDGNDPIRLARWDEPFSISAEAYRNTTFSILLSSTTAGPRSYVITSASDSEGKTTVTLNLAVAISKSRRRVVLIDGDMRKPSIHKAFGLECRSGLREILREGVDLGISPHYLKRTGVPNLDVITAGAGEEDSMSLLHSPELKKLLAVLYETYDMVLIDTPPMLHIADARAIAKHTNGAILIVRAGNTTLQSAQAARDIFDKDGIRIIGVILNGFDPTKEGDRTFYSSYERYQVDASVAQGETK